MCKYVHIYVVPKTQVVQPKVAIGNYGAPLGMQSMCISHRCVDLFQEYHVRFCGKFGSLHKEGWDDPWVHHEICGRFLLPGTAKDLSGFGQNTTGMCTVLGSNYHPPN